MLVTRYVTRLSQRESRTPTRTDPIRTEPALLLYVAEFQDQRLLSQGSRRVIGLGAST